jgi:hypothetical protein
MVQGSEEPAARSAGDHTEGTPRAPATRIASPRPAAARRRWTSLPRTERTGRTRRPRGTPPRSHYETPPTASRQPARRGAAESFRQRTSPRTSTHSHDTSHVPNEDFVAISQVADAVPHRQRPPWHSRPRPRPPSNGHSGRGRIFFAGPRLHPSSCSKYATGGMKRRVAGAFIPVRANKKRLVG